MNDVASKKGTENKRISQKTKGIICILGSAFFFTCMNTFVRLAGDIPSMQKSFFRNLVAMLFAYFMVRRGRLSLKVEKKNWGALFLRCSIGTIGILCNFYAVDHLVLADATILNKLSPFFAIIFSFFVLKESVSIFQGACVLIAFAGSLLIVKPGFTDVSIFPALIGVAGGMTAGFAYTMVRVLGGRQVKGPVIVFCFSAFSCVTLLPNLLLNFTPMTLAQLITLLMAGLAAAGGQFCITAAYTFAPARELSVYDYMQVVFGAVFGFFLFGQIPDLYSVLGYVIIVGVSIVMFVKNQKA